jgi:hypothetical protein
MILNSSIPKLGLDGGVANGHSVMQSVLGGRGDGMDAQPGGVLADVRTLRDRGRRLAHGGAWFPALVLAALLLLSIGLYRGPFTSLVELSSIGPFEPIAPAGLVYPYWGGLPHDLHSQLASYVFWLVGEPLAFVALAWWYRRRERRLGVRLPWKAPIVAGIAGLVGLLALMAAPTGATDRVWGVTSVGQGLLTPLVSVGLAVTVLGIVERSVGIAVSGLWIAWVAWQVCSLGELGGLFGWQTWLMTGGTGPALGGQLTLLGLDRPGPTLIAMALPLVCVAGYRALRIGGSRSGD